jgi:hypothetical protein
MIALVAALLAAAAQVPTADEALAWLKSLDARPESAQKQPRFPNLSVDDLQAMKEIRLGGHRASDNKHVFIPAAEFRFLLALPALEKVNLVEIDGLTDEALVFVGKLAALKDLNLGDAQVSSAGLKSLSGLKSLARLQVGWTKDVGNEALPVLSPLSKLEYLGLGGTKVTDDGMPALAAFANLKELHLMETAVTDRGLEALAACKSLEKIQLNKKTKVTPQGIEALKKALPACTVLVK